MFFYVFCSDATTKLFHIFTSNAKTNASNDTKRIVNEQNNQNYYPSTTTYDYDNPFLQAPFHHSHKTHSSTQASSSSSINADSNSSSSFDPTSIVVGKRLSAFAPYHRQDPSGNASGEFQIDLSFDQGFFLSHFFRFSC